MAWGDVNVDKKNTHIPVTTATVFPMMTSRIQIPV
jgi:hypothetical protein